MAVRRQKITPIGWEIKKRLAELQITHTEFCETHNIPLSRLSEIISGTRPNKRYHKQIVTLLKIEESA